MKLRNLGSRPSLRLKQQSQDRQPANQGKLCPAGKSHAKLQSAQRLKQRYNTAAVHKQKPFRVGKKRR
eukprot:scaffold314326_cov21-Tisochrysis_lutea.AAC.1